MDEMQKLALPMNPTPAILKILLEALLLLLDTMPSEQSWG